MEPSRGAFSKGDLATERFRVSRSNPLRRVAVQRRRAAADLTQVDVRAGPHGRHDRIHRSDGAGPCALSKAAQACCTGAAAAALAAWAAAVCRFAAIGGDDAYYAGYAASFIVPVLAQALNPADPDAGHIALSCQRPSRVAAALAATLAALNSTDRLYLAFTWDPAAPPAPQLRAALIATALKAAASLLVAGWLRARLACALNLPFTSSNARLLEKFHSPQPAAAAAGLAAR
jgi:hypothetical protein